MLLLLLSGPLPPPPPLFMRRNNIRIEKKKMFLFRSRLRMLKAIVALTRTPQNNLRIFQVLPKASTQIKLKEIGASGPFSF